MRSFIHMSQSIKRVSKEDLDVFAGAFDPHTKFTLNSSLHLFITYVFLRIILCIGAKI